MGFEPYKAEEKIKETKRLRDEGKSVAEISTLLGISDKTVYKYLKELHKRVAKAFTGKEAENAKNHLIYNYHQRTEKLWEIIKDGKNQYIQMQALSLLRLEDEHLGNIIAEKGKDETRPSKLPSLNPVFEVEKDANPTPEVHSTTSPDSSSSE